MEKAPVGLELITQYFSDFTPQQLQQFAALDELYREWNGRINVISRKDIDSLYEKHILHSLAIAAAFEFEKGAQVIDIGTGGGFPGVPLAIFFPETQFHLVDSIGKKIKIVEAVKEAIGLTNLTAQHTRVEDIKNRKFDLAVSRAVAPLKDLWTWARPLLKKPGQNADGSYPRKDSRDAGQEIPTFSLRGLICLKGGDLAAEISDSGTRPRIMEITELFPLEYFKEKYVLHVPY